VSGVEVGDKLRGVDAARLGERRGDDLETLGEALHRVLRQARRKASFARQSSR
jgi:hypothetical protein